ncbi:MAG: alpha/beta hydrolase [Rhodobacter sp.]|nr:alpha/beta hydrolase [Rhodobacter sp.]MCA3513825.1 alpha/beta hydrolase [Rhodobacter sp.]MCA3520437.1 alpha/beta hydrolase [Rhodobacter sp.]MCA3523429.1 alpha/beta hydrolase [Rhodobacter sp.]MCA3524638.1 alpha/beta hydrolase [Rhodobacter sp.]
MPAPTLARWLVLAALLALPAQAQEGGPPPGDLLPGGGPGPGYTLHADLAYADSSATANLLDIYVPDGVANPPLVVNIHGGGFAMGDKSDLDALDMFTRAGIAVASINYRLSDEAIWPAQREDVLDAFAFLRAHGDEYGYDETRMASYGASAGGHLSALAGIALAADPATALKASVVLFPPVLFSGMDADMAAVGMTPAMGSTDDARSAESRLIGAPVGENPDLAMAASPLPALAALPPDAQLPAFLILHGADDRNISRIQSGRLFMAILSRPGTRDLQYGLLPDSGHGTGAFRRLDVMLDVVSFLRARLGT